ncbi:hypothetical protein BP6252_11116 [Coleophoma cylindrospora]|uniref:Heterokaryon incompatibility domain-containing protein n=1 Tax=Coleophoma cylindrospora TaxID=1849047 RepID=A0A3D8QPC0_9HELO|nr:hypothetical protein BP6252_11116 [Coleophoma cylindrospora]
MKETATGQPKTRFYHRCLLHGTPLLFCRQNTHHDRYECIFTRCRQWLDACLAGHPGRGSPASVCGTALGSAQFHSTCPSRLIDVGVTGEAPRLVKFDSLDQVQEVSTPARYAGYVTLSYCWGPKSDYGHLLRQENEAQFHRALPPLPKTIQDVVEVCRRIGVRFLWVDAICIIQGGPGGASTDWELESARVGSYYANALFTIAAASAGGSDEGCLPDRAYSYHGQLISHISLRHISYLGNESPSRNAAFYQWSTVTSEKGNVLRRRGWTTQELSLAPRILWLGPSGAVWSCRTEDRGYWGATPYRSDVGKFHARMKNNWNQLLVSYSTTALSFPEDRLPALSGICKFLDPDASDQYLAGIWLSSLSDGLFWLVNNMVSPRADVTRYKDMSLPSWSPLATGQIITYQTSWPQIQPGVCIASAPCLTCGPGRLGLEKSSVNLRYGDIHGRIVSAWLEIRAKVYVAVFSLHGMVRGSSDQLWLENSMVLYGGLYLDEPKSLQNDPKPSEPAKEFYSVLLSHDGDDKFCHLKFLLLELAAKPNSYRRVGAFMSKPVYPTSPEAQFFQKAQVLSEILLV